MLKTIDGMMLKEMFASGAALVERNRASIDALNVFLVTLTAFVAFTTAIFSGPYMRVERDHGKMTPPRLRLYHSMYQLFSFTMLLALMTNNMGILWVAMEAATLTTVLLVSVYRTAASLEAAWKYFILCGVGIAQALFGTVLLYMAAEKVIGTEGGALLWTNLEAVKAQLDPNIIALAFAFLFIGYGTKGGLKFENNGVTIYTTAEGQMVDITPNVAPELYHKTEFSVLVDVIEGKGDTGGIPVQASLMMKLIDAVYVSSKTGKSVDLV